MFNLLNLQRPQVQTYDCPEKLIKEIWDIKPSTQWNYAVGPEELK